jgi:hypothetical protein
VSASRELYRIGQIARGVACALTGPSGILIVPVVAIEARLLEENWSSLL